MRALSRAKSNCPKVGGFVCTQHGDLEPIETEQGIIVTTLGKLMKVGQDHAIICNYLYSSFCHYIFNYFCREMFNTFFFFFLLALEALSNY